MRPLIILALVFDALLILVAVNTIFLQTHWNDPTYVGMVVVVMGTPILNAAALLPLTYRRDHARSTEA